MQMDGMQGICFKRLSGRVTLISPKHWTPPKITSLKINVDYAFDKALNKAAISLVIWNNEGIVIDVATQIPLATSIFME